ncbi:MAG: N-acyl-D-amino-acid deacylase [Sphingomonadales bacterium]|jgi:N-acyl-D-amino-acid deacylase|nr:N-acyl-D-amino-acid deacylase [Sphingomonadales bacterium]
MLPRLVAALLLTLSSCAAARDTPPLYDTVIRGGTIYDGSGGAPYKGDVAIKRDRIAAVAPHIAGRGRSEVNAAGLAVAPGFINMLSWAAEPLIRDGKAQSDVRQGVTLEVMGEGWSMGPFSPGQKAEAEAEQTTTRYKIGWTTLGQFLDFLEKKGVSVNVASMVGASTVRVHELGRNDVDPTPEQLQRMRVLVRQAMDEGAMGVGSSLIYVPAIYAETDELAALAGEAGRCGGMYLSHMRSESSRLLDAIDELVEISRRSGARAEIYHLKVGGRSNWPLMDPALARIETARAAGVPVTANMYLYTASGTGLDSTLPIWVREGGPPAMLARLRDPAVRARVVAEMRGGTRDWTTVQPVGFANPALRRYVGKRLPEIAALRGKEVEETAVDLIVEDDSSVTTIFHSISEENLRKVLAKPWVSFGSDAAAIAVEPPFTDKDVHPRTYGNFARLLGRYVRDEKAMSLAEAVRRLTSLPADNLRIADRGRLRNGFFADLALFDPAKIADRATYEKPHQYAVGMRHVFVNGVQVLRDGEHTGATPGRFVHGPGWRKCK